MIIETTVPAMPAPSDSSFGAAHIIVDEWFRGDEPQIVARKVGAVRDFFDVVWGSRFPEYDDVDLIAVLVQLGRRGRLEVHDVVVAQRKRTHAYVAELLDLVVFHDPRS